jgi:putative flavoprotein involved in K+ transport
VIGAGQAGLAAGWQLRRRGLSFQILEASDRPGGAWRDYYDSLTLFSPAEYSSLPGTPFPGAPDHYPTRDEVVGYLEDYAHRQRLPVRTGKQVISVARKNGVFTTRTADGESVRSRAVIAASGAFGRPYWPTVEGHSDFAGRQLHSGGYRGRQGFEGLRVVVVGGANSAVQIAVELATVARVSLASRRPIRFVPQRFLGKDFHFWLKITGLDKTRWLDDQSTPVLDDGTYRRAIRAAAPDRRPMFRCVLAGGVEWADGSVESVDCLLFATGFRPDVAYLSALEAVDADGRLRQRNGVSTTTPGLYFVGFPKQRNFASATLRGVGPDADYVVERLSAHLRQLRPDMTTSEESVEEAAA